LYITVVRLPAQNGMPYLSVLANFNRWVGPEIDGSKK
jgi:hypothetical protein